MLSFVARRLLGLVPILFGLSVLLFAWVRALPGDPTAALLGRDQGVRADRATSAAVAEVRRLYGLDRPLHRQYLSYLRNVARMDLGHSITTHRPVTTELRRRFPATVELAVAALALAVAVGVPLGVLAARRSRTWFDHLSLAAALVAVSVPVFVAAFVLKYVFAVKLGWLPSAGRADVTRGAAHPTGLYLVDAVLTLDGAALVDALRHLILPAVTLAVPSAAFITRITRAAVLDVASEDYVRTATSKGVAARAVERRHVLRTALLPVTTTVGLTAGFLLSGAVLIEFVFAWGGVGTLIQQALTDRDYPVLQAAILFVAVVFVVVNLVVDLAYARLDPRVRLRARAP